MHPGRLKTDLPADSPRGPTLNNLSPGCQTPCPAIRVGLHTSFRNGRVDAARFTENGKFYFTATALKDYQTRLTPLGEPKLIERFGKNGLRAEPVTGLIEQFAVYPFSE